MGHQFEAEQQVEVPATPEQVWAAIATGPGIDSWFMGRNEVRPGETVRMAFGGYAPEHRVTAWEEGSHLAYGGEAAPDGRFIAHEFLIEGRAGGSTVLRMVTSGFLPGDDWADEYEAMQAGGALFFATLVTYLTHFAGRTATPITAFGPIVPDWGSAWAALHAELGLSAPPAKGDQVRLRADGLPPIDGAVYFTNPQTLGLRTPDAMYRFVQGFQGGMVAMHHLFTEVDQADTERAWQHWLQRVFS
jgi:uncharacterized protein YndB with AHSA1/START domain